MDCNGAEGEGLAGAAAAGSRVRTNSDATLSSSARAGSICAPGFNRPTALIQLLVR